MRKQPAPRLSESGGTAEEQNFGFDGQEAERTGADADSAGQYTDKTPVQVDGDWSSVASAVIGAAVAIESLIVNDQPKEKESKKQVVERKNRQKKKQSQNHDWEMSL